MKTKYSSTRSACVLMLTILTLTACGARKSTSAASESSAAPVSAESSVSAGSSEPAESTKSAESSVSAESSAPAENSAQQETQTDTQTAAEPAPRTDDMSPYYALLNDAQKTVYDQLVAAISKGIPTITPEVNITQDEFDQVSEAVYLEQPQLFWINNKWSWTYNSATGYVASATVEFNTLFNNYKDNAAAFNTAVRDALSGTEGMNDTGKEKAIHDYLAETVVYEANDYDQSAYSALVNHTSVCEGYARAFQYLMQCAGIPTFIAEGSAVNYETGEWESHAWNIVKLGDGYYNVDVTWDDTMLADKGLISYVYYNQTDEYILTDHARNDTAAALPACTAAEYTFESLYGVPAALGAVMEIEGVNMDPIDSLEKYYEVLERDVTAAGTGTHTFLYIVQGDDTIAQISQAVSDNSTDKFISGAARSLGLNGYSCSINIEYEGLRDGYYYLTQEVSLK